MPEFETATDDNGSVLVSYVQRGGDGKLTESRTIGTYENAAEANKAIDAVYQRWWQDSSQNDQPRNVQEAQKRALLDAKPHEAYEGAALSLSEVREAFGHSPRSFTGLLKRAGISANENGDLSQADIERLLSLPAFKNSRNYIQARLPKSDALADKPTIEAPPMRRQAERELHEAEATLREEADRQEAQTSKPLPADYDSQEAIDLRGRAVGAMEATKHIERPRKNEEYHRKYPDRVGESFPEPQDPDGAIGAKPPSPPPPASPQERSALSSLDSQEKRVLSNLPYNDEERARIQGLYEQDRQNILQGKDRDLRVSEEIDRISRKVIRRNQGPQSLVESDAAMALTMPRGFTEDTIRERIVQRFKAIQEAHPDTEPDYAKIESAPIKETIALLDTQEKSIGAESSAGRIRVALKVLQRKASKQKSQLPEKTETNALSSYVDSQLYAPDQPEEPKAKKSKLYQGHKGPGVGQLKETTPERRDGDGDTVVGERRPRVADAFEHSPAPIPKKLRGASVEQVSKDELRTMTQHNFSKEQREEIKSNYAQEKKAIRAGGEELPRIRQELAEKRAAIIETAKENGPRQVDKRVVEAVQKARRERTPTKRTTGSRSKRSDLIKKNAGRTHTPWRRRKEMMAS